MISNFLKATFMLGALVSFAAPSFAATVSTPESTSGVSPDGASVWVVNSHGLALRVYLVDSSGEEHRIGTVTGDIQSIELPAELINQGPVRIKVRPVPPPSGLGVSVANLPAVRTRDLAIQPGAEVYFFVERDLTQSTTTVAMQ